MKLYLLGLLFIVLLPLLSCTQVQNIGLKKHLFSIGPRKIIWLQVEGLHEEHFALLKMFNNGVDKKVSIEESLCFGKNWSYDLFSLRPSSVRRSLAQFSGSNFLSPKEEISKDIVDDVKRGLIWRQVAYTGAKMVFFEQAREEKSLLNHFIMKEEETLKDLSFYRMDHHIQINPKKKKKWFNTSLGEIPQEKGEIYYNYLCKQQKCKRHFSEEVIDFFVDFQKGRNNYLFIIRDTYLGDAIERDDKENIILALSELNQLISFFQEETKKAVNSDLLLLITSYNSKIPLYPKEGKHFSTPTDLTQMTFFKESSLLSPIWASGAKAENFCGLMEERELLNRMSFPEVRQKKFY